MGGEYYVGFYAAEVEDVIMYHFPEAVAAFFVLFFAEESMSAQLGFDFVADSVGVEDDFRADEVRHVFFEVFCCEVVAAFEVVGFFQYVLWGGENEMSTSF